MSYAVLGGICPRPTAAAEDGSRLQRRNLTRGDIRAIPYFAKPYIMRKLVARLVGCFHRSGDGIGD